MLVINAKQKLTDREHHLLSEQNNGRQSFLQNNVNSTRH